MADSSILDLVVQVLLLGALIAGIALFVVLIKADKRDKFISCGRFDLQKFWMELVSTFGKGVGWVLLIFATLLGSSLVLKIIL